MTALHDRDAILSLLTEFATALAEGRFDAFEQILDRDMVIATPEAPAGLIVGRDAVIEVYRAFLGQVRVTEYQEEPPWVRVWGDAASAGCAWVLAWEDDEGSYAAFGQDVYALARRPEGWRIVSRLLIEGDVGRGALTAWSQGEGAFDQAA